MMKRDYISILFFVLLSCLFLYSCSAKRKVRKADQAFYEYKYDKARKAYSKVLRKVKDKDEKERIRWQIAESYRYKDDLENGQVAYQNLIQTKYHEKEPLVYYHLGNILLKRDRLDRALPALEKYVELAPEDTLGILALQRVALAREYEVDPGQYEVEVEKKLNSELDDWAPIYSNSALNEIIFTSNRNASTGKNKDEWTGKKFSDLYIARKDLKGKWTDPKLLDENETINTDLNEGTPAMNGHFTTLYFTRCEKPEGRPGGCAVYTSKRTGTVWGAPQRIDMVEDSSAVIGHPAITSDESMIIVSAILPGSKGGKDLYYALGSGGSFGDLQNLGDVINTPGNEMFPYLRGDSVLYFSSDYHPGMGGLDIFKSTITYDEEGEPTFSEPVNMRYPINSIGDDLGICFHPEGNEEGFFSSNRKYANGLDIYHFIIEPVIFTISGVVRDMNTLLYVPDVTITLIGSDSTVITIKTGESGSYTFPKTQVKPNTEYTVVVEREGYFSVEEKISTVGLETSKNFKVDILNFQPVPREPVVLPEILFDYGKWELKPQYGDSLRGLIQVLEANPTVAIELAAHTDSRGSEEANRDLSQKRAQSVVDYLIDRGIDGDRLTAKGYGKMTPRTLQKDITRDGFKFPAGTNLNDEYIASLSSRIHQEAAHQMNRRIEFVITSTRYVPKQGKERARPDVTVATGDNRKGIAVEFVGKKELPQVEGFINGMSESVIIDESLRNATISLETALGLLRDGYITKDDFEGDPEKVLVGGTISKNARFIINDLRIGGKSTYDITVIVDHTYKLPLTIPASVMQDLGDYTIDKERRMLFFE